jgi:hypothetical protein
MSTRSPGCGEMRSTSGVEVRTATRPTSQIRASELVRRSISNLSSALASAPPDLVSGPDAAIMAELFAQVERSAAAGKALYARKVAESGAYGASGHRDAAGWLADVSGESRGHALGMLATAELACQVPEVQRAFCNGDLSGAQAKVIGEAAALDPSATEDLLHAADSESFATVAAMAARVIRKARSEEDLEREEARVHTNRYCRTFSPRDGGLRIEALLTKQAGARLVSRLDQMTEVLFTESMGSDNPASHEHCRADALVELVGGHDPSRHRTPGKSRGAPSGGGQGSSGGPSCDRGPGLGKSGPNAHVVVRVDAGALRRGWVEGSEICEIPGIGAVPVATARQILGDAFFNILVTDGVDVRCVTGTKRTIPTPLRVALSERDPTCVVPGCGVARHLEIDHWQRDYSMDGPTCLDNLARLCGRHHAMKTYTGWRLAGGPGHWKWVPPESPRASPTRPRTRPTRRRPGGPVKARDPGSTSSSG